MDLQAEVVVANRPYADPDASASGGGAAEGGLLVALRGVIEPWRGTGGTTWIGGQRVKSGTKAARDYEFVPMAHGILRQRRVAIDEATWAGHYAESSNSFLWPLLHLTSRRLPDLAEYYPAPVVPSDEGWAAYRRANQAFADAVIGAAGDTCWVHDYQLALVPRMLREHGYRGRIGFFLHTPFPDIDIALGYLTGEGKEFLAEFVQGLLQADLVGFQSHDDEWRFGQATGRLGLDTAGGEGLPERLSQGLSGGHRTTTIPVGVDAEPEHEALDEDIAPLTADDLRGLPLVVGLERFDFTKGIPERLRTVARVISDGGRFRYVGIAAPTREGVPVYDGLRAVVEDAANEARTAAAKAGLPFLHAERALSQGAVASLLSEADVIFTSSLSDGMNLVPLQGVIAHTCRPDAKRGVIIAGQDTGAVRTYRQFDHDGLRPVDPLSPDDMDAALRESLDNTSPRVSDRFGLAVRALDAHHWAQRFLSELHEVTG